LIPLPPLTCRSTSTLSLARCARGDGADGVRPAGARCLPEAAWRRCFKTSDAELIDGTQYLLFPNFVPWPSLLNPIVYRFRPLNNDPDWSIWETMFFLPFKGERHPRARSSM